MIRNATKVINIGSVAVGGGASVSIQSMTKTDTRDCDATVDQIHQLEEAGCEIIRVAVPDAEAARRLDQITSRITIPLIADIHFDYRLALMALDAGVGGLRINPGNIGGEAKVAEVVKKARQCTVPIRIGVNAGSLEKDLLEQYGHPTPQALVDSALRHVRLLEKHDFDLIKVSIKASDVCSTVAAYRLFAAVSHYPLHVGVTEAGPGLTGIVKSSIGIGILLADGIGDTIRVSLTAPPLEEVRVGKRILQALNLRRWGPVLVSCPTCGRCEMDIQGLAHELENRLEEVTKPITVAVMGCAVNGPSEAREADIGIAGGKESGILFKKGQLIGKVPREQLLERLMEEIRSLK